MTEWVDECARLAMPDRIHWCDGSDQEYHALVAGMLKDGTLLELDPGKQPGSYLHRSHPSDVARSENLTFICTEQKDDAGPTNNWMSPRDAVEKLAKSVGGTVEAFYFAFGETDAYVLVELPDNVTAAAVALTVGASGLAKVKTTVLLTVEEADAASKLSPAYRAPGQ